ncbi:4-alpha-L-fucosyltransferase glycosyl transferase group 56 [Mesonia phycicola]|uniref:4-alpha-L-fucosyltransferase glycosyl transferase group 56 n=1 Tax=Mesonia phycicola TaxID=579105 RepID=A0A1M6H2H9_9FLAO|nr:TDP-N-acetylfucosamine:lipid II N-acetylfucosaminyltransferase [Mesonia phycicola]SHJ16389.1 4-alpha-L-fucosyltransferase glycosyl transferase group 56 [Mesonia phycicola]
MKILHLIDNEKFTNYAIEMAISSKANIEFKISHDFLVLGEDTQLISRAYQDLVTFIPNFKLYKSYIEKSNVEILVIHCLTVFKCMALYNSMKNFKSVCWSMWGVDFYSSPYYKQELYGNETKNIRHKFFKYDVKKILRPLFYYMKYGTTYKKSFLYVIKHVDFVSPIIPNEFDLIKKIPSFKGEYLAYGNGDIESLSNFISPESKNVNNIFIGNSSTYESNHIEVMRKIYKEGLEEGQKIFVPLSYGGNEKYKLELVKVGKSLFGDKFVPIFDFLKLKEYNHILNSCSYAFFNHKRQQAVGNILPLLLQGKKVFLSGDNILYNYFLDIGIKVFNINLPYNSAFLSSTEIKINREIVLTYFSREKIINNHYLFYKTLVDASK